MGTEKVSGASFRSQDQILPYQVQDTSLSMLYILAFSEYLLIYVAGTCSSISKYPYLFDNSFLENPPVFKK